jgi:hypothetical protein
MILKVAACETSGWITLEKNEGRWSTAGVPLVVGNFLKSLEGLGMDAPCS